MKCPSCSAEIADKAIVCYRCGAPTTAPAPTRPRARPANRARLIALVVILLVVLAIFVFMLFRLAE